MVASFAVSTLRRLALLFAAWLVVSGCSANPYPGEEGTVLHVSMRGLPKSFDPPLIGTEFDNKPGSQVFEGLLMYHPYARPYQLIPAIAASMPEISEDGLTYTFTLRRDVTFHDDPAFPGGEGRAVTAQDFVFAFKRLAHPRSRTTGWWLFSGKIKGLDAWRDQLTRDTLAAEQAGEAVDTLWGLDRPVEGLTALDDHTLQIQLAEPYPQFLWTLAMNYTAVYPREAVAAYGAEVRTHPVGTGPFRVVEVHPTYRMVLEANPDYRDVRVPDPRHDPADRLPGWDWEADEAAGFLAHAGERLPLVDGIEIRFILEDQPRWLYYKAGYSDWLNPPKDNQAEALQGKELSPAMKARGTKLTLLPETGTVYTCFNTDDPVMSKPALRQAISLAVDLNWMVDNLYSGSAVVAESLIPPGISGHEDGYHPWRPADGGADLERARAKLAEAGYPGGVDPATGKPLRIRFETSGTSTTNRQFAERFRDELRRIGIEVDIIVNTWPQMNEKMRNRDFQSAALAWGFDYPDAQNIFQLLYGPNQAPGINRSNYANPAFDTLFEQASGMVDGPERSALYQQMARMVADDVPWLVRVHRIRPNLQQPWVQGARYTDVHAQWWRYASVDRADRDRRVAAWNQPVLWPVYLALGLLAALIAGTVMGQRRAAKEAA
ncbi:MAG: hypothetical protein H6739_34450 [Alphaproteobacteria bacterium]|nr:hypothetical protein [Alphaproteobacteria bacterium]